MGQAVTAFLVVLALALAVAVIALWLRLRQAVQREALQALAARRGWGLTFVGQRLGQPSVLRLSPRAGVSWTVTVRGEETGVALLQSAPQSTEFVADEPRWDDGLLIVAPPWPPEEPGTEQPDLPGSRAQLARLIGDELAGYSEVLRAYPSPPGLTILASADPAHRADLGDLAKAYAGWGMKAAGPDGFPILVLGKEGLRVRLRHGTRRADHMEGFIDFALDLSRIL